jgi:hypothetical protein
MAVPADEIGTSEGNPPEMCILEGGNRLSGLCATG